MPIMTAYRQRALACAALLVEGPRRPRDLRAAVPDAAKILLRNVYGWFARTERGVYALTPAGRDALARWPQQAVREATDREEPAIDHAAFAADVERLEAKG